ERAGVERRGDRLPICREQRGWSSWRAHESADVFADRPAETGGTCAIDASEPADREDVTLDHPGLRGGGLAYVVRKTLHEPQRVLDAPLGTDAANRRAREQLVPRF